MEPEQVDHIEPETKSGSVQEQWQVKGPLKPLLQIVDPLKGGSVLIAEKIMNMPREKLNERLLTIGKRYQANVLRGIPWAGPALGGLLEDLYNIDDVTMDDIMNAVKENKEGIDNIQKRVTELYQAVENFKEVVAAGFESMTANFNEVREQITSSTREIIHTIVLDSFEAATERKLFELESLFELVLKNRNRYHMETFMNECMTHSPLLLAVNIFQRLQTPGRQTNPMTAAMKKEDKPMKATYETWKTYTENLLSRVNFIYYMFTYFRTEDEKERVREQANMDDYIDKICKVVQNYEDPEHPYWPNLVKEVVNEVILDSQVESSWKVVTMRNTLTKYYTKYVMYIRNDS